MRSFSSMKYQIAAAAALLLSGLYVAAAAAPADQAQWSKSIPIDEKRNPGERLEAYIVDGLLHARRLDQNDTPFGTSSSPKPIQTNPLHSNISALALPSKCVTPTARTSSAIPGVFPRP